MIHDIKCEPLYFTFLLNNEKTFEIRKNDRNYQPEDFLRIKEYSKRNGYTGREILYHVSYILYVFKGLKKGYCIMSIKKW